MSGVRNKKAAVGSVLGSFPFRCHPLAWAAVMASGCWAFSADSAFASCSPDGPVAERAGDCMVPESPRQVAETGSAALPPDSIAAKTPLPVAAPMEAPQEVEFNPAFFTGNVADLSRYTRGNPVAPGLYPLELFVNGKKRGRLE